MLVDPQIGYITVILQFLQAVSNLWIEYHLGEGGGINHAICGSNSILVQSPSSVLGEFIWLCW